MTALLALFALASAADVGSVGAIPPEVLRAAEQSRALPLAERMAAVSEPLLHVPYVSDPLGEGRAPDPDPLARYDAFDCLTFLEEVMALSLSHSPEHAAAIRLDLRYGEHPPEYRYRHHFMELQWIPSAIQRGWVTPISRDFGPVQVYEREVNSATWAAWSSRARFALDDSELPSGTMRLEYLSLKDALAVVDQIPPGTIVMTVREDRSWSPIWISHVGFVVPGDAPTIRHATNTRSTMDTRDQGLAWYLRHLMTYKNWKAVGVALYRPIEAGPLRVLP